MMLYPENRVLQLVPCLGYPGTEISLEFSLSAHKRGMCDALLVLGRKKNWILKLTGRACKFKVKLLIHLYTETRDLTELSREAEK